MKQRSQALMLALIGGPVLLGLVYLALVQFFTLADYDRKIQALNDDASKKNVEAVRIAKHEKLQRWRDLSLPADAHLAQREYSRYLHDLLRGKVTEMSLQPSAPTQIKGQGTLNKKTMYTTLPFNVRGKATLTDLAAVLEKFQRTPVVHKVKSLSLERDPSGGEKGPLNVNLAVEALIVDGVSSNHANLAGVDPRLIAIDALAGLQRGPVGIAWAAWVVGPRGPASKLMPIAEGRTYADIAARNIFTGAPAPKPPPEVAKATDEAPPEPEPEPDETPQYIYLTEINQTETQQEAHLFNRATNRSMRLRAEEGYNLFPIGDPRAKSPLQGKVIRIDSRDVFFSVNQGQAVYGVHIGQTLSEARTLRQSEVQELQLNQAPRKETPEAEAPAKAATP